MSARSVAGAAVGAVVVGAAVAAGVVAGRRRAEMRATVDEDLHHPLLLTPGFVNSATVKVLRRTGTGGSEPVPGVAVHREELPPRGADPSVPVWVYEPQGRTRPSGVVVYVHGGGFVIGDPVDYHDRCSAMAAELGVLVVSVHYRLAPDHPFPAALEDCFTALAWVHEQGERLGVDPRRVAVMGDSAGGGLAACLAQAALDRDIPVALQVLIYPMLDDRTVLRDDHAGAGSFVWQPANNRFGWTSYLGREPSQAAPPPYAAAARREDLAGLAPAWIGVGDLDLFHAEDVEYADRLRDAGVAVELVVVPRMYHAADALRADAPGMVAFRESWLASLRSVIAPG